MEFGFDAIPGISWLVAIHSHDQVQAWKALGQRLTKAVHHSGGCAHECHPPVVRCGVFEERPGQFDAGGLHHTDPLPSQGPDHSSTIRDHQVCPLDGVAQLRQAASRHRHLSVEGDDATTTTGVQPDGS